MSGFVVSRIYGRRRNSDFLCGWDDRWGTVCIGNPRLALQFETEAEANKAKARAACLLMTSLCGTVFGWEVVPL